MSGDGSVWSQGTDTDMFVSVCSSSSRAIIFGVFHFNKTLCNSLNLKMKIIGNTCEPWIHRRE